MSENKLQQQPVTVSNSHFLGNLLPGYEPVQCHLKDTAVCPHPECDGFKRLCEDWIKHSGR